MFSRGDTVRRDGAGGASRRTARLPPPLGLLERAAPALQGAQGVGGGGEEGGRARRARRPRRPRGAGAPAGAVPARARAGEAARGGSGTRPRWPARPAAEAGVAGERAPGAGRGEGPARGGARGAAGRAADCAAPVPAHRPYAHGPAPLLSWPPRGPASRLSDPSTIRARSGAGGPSPRAGGRSAPRAGPGNGARRGAPDPRTDGTDAHPGRRSSAIRRNGSCGGSAPGGGTCPGARMQRWETRGAGSGHRAQGSGAGAGGQSVAGSAPRGPPAGPPEAEFPFVRRMGMRSPWSGRPARAT